MQISHGASAEFECSEREDLAEDLLAPEAEVLEGVALRVYDEAREDPYDPVSPVRLARALIGSDAVTIVPRHALRTTWAMLVRIGDRAHIVVRRDVPDGELGHTIAHELAHWVLRREGMRDTEEACDYLAAALVAPTSAFRRALALLGPRLAKLAKAFRTTETLVALRWGEISWTPLALVRPGRVRVRGQLEFVWPPEPTIRRWARGVAPRGLARTVLTDARHRVLLVADRNADAALQEAG